MDSRDEAPQYALPLVVRVERGSPPTRTDALEGAARAVLWFLDDPRVTDSDGEWADAVHAWTDGRIRKVVRLARGAGWERASALPGITITQGSAEIRVYPPVPVDEWPPAHAHFAQADRIVPEAVTADKTADHHCARDGTHTLPPRGVREVAGAGQ